MLRIAGLWGAAQAYVATLTGAALIEAESALYDANHWHRDSPFLAACAAGLGLTDTQLDELFVEAEKLNP